MEANDQNEAKPKTRMQHVRELYVERKDALKEAEDTFGVVDANKSNNRMRFSFLPSRNELRVDCLPGTFFVPASLIPELHAYLCNLMAPVEETP